MTNVPACCKENMDQFPAASSPISAHDLEVLPHLSKFSHLVAGFVRLLNIDLHERSFRLVLRIRPEAPESALPLSSSSSTLSSATSVPHPP